MSASVDCHPSAEDPDGALQARVRALEDEIVRLRREADDKRQLEVMVGQLREANEHLVLATVNAQHLREDAEAANRRQNEFLAMLAHELRNPLSPIAMAASLLERGAGATPQQLKLARVVGRQVDHMARLLDDLLDAARISSGKITLALEPLGLADVLRHAVETVQPRISERAQLLDVVMPPDGVAVEGDQVRLAQVFTNLLGNASKYTGDGGRLRLTAAMEDGAEGGVIVTIEDNGTGIAADVIPYIFDLFTQGPRSLARSEGGLGVGLNVVRNLVGMHHGQVEAHSAGSGCGSRFTVRLPRCAGAPPKPVAAPALAVGAPRRVLLVEDNADACATLADCLRGEGHEVVCALDGPSGLALALEGRWDAVVCDIGLPGLDGLGLMQALRAAPQAGAPGTPVAIALTGYGQPEDRARGLAAGFDHYFVKPVSVQLLLDLLAALPAPAVADAVVDAAQSVSA